MYKDLIKKMATECELSQKKAKETISEIFLLIEKTVNEDQSIAISNFGTFKPSHSSSRMARNPRNGEEIFVPEKIHMHFKPGKHLKEAIQKKRVKK